MPDPAPLTAEPRSAEQVLAEAKRIADMKSLVSPTVFHLAAMQAKMENLKAALDAAEARLADARREALCPLCSHEWRRHDPEDGRCDAPHLSEAGPCWCGRDMAAWQEMNANASRIALAAPRSTEETTP